MHRCPTCGQQIRPRRDPDATLIDLQDMIVTALATRGPQTANGLQRILRRRRTDLRAALRELDTTGAVDRSPTGWWRTAWRPRHTEPKGHR